MAEQIPVLLLKIDVPSPLSASSNVCYAQVSFALVVHTSASRRPGPVPAGHVTLCIKYRASS
jgi:hypothetical protein